MKIKINIRTINSIMLIFCIVLMDNCFYLIDRSNINILGFISYNNIWLLAFLAFISYNYIKHKVWEKRTSYNFGLEVAFLILLVFVQAIRGRITFDQSIYAGFIGQINYLIILFSYYPIRKFYLKHIVDNKTIDKGIIVFGILAFIIYLLQIQLIDKTIFLYDVHMSKRYGSARLYVDSVFCVITGFFGIDNFLRTQKYNNLILVILAVIYETYISKGRLEFVAFCGSLAVGLLLMKRYTLKKALIVCAGILLVFVFMNSQWADFIFEAIGDLRNNTGTMSIRSYGRALYASRLSKSFSSLLFGCGFPASEMAKLMSGQNESVLLVDNGIFAFTYVYGIIGLIAVIILFSKMLRLAWMLYKVQNKYIGLVFSIFNIAIIYNIAFWWWKSPWTIIMIIMMCKMEHELYDSKTPIKSKKNHLL